MLVRKAFDHSSVKVTSAPILNISKKVSDDEMPTLKLSELERSSSLLVVFDTVQYEAAPEPPSVAVYSLNGGAARIL